MARPVIGVATPARLTPAWPFIALSILISGGRPRRLPPAAGRNALEEIDGLVVGGGDDISADLYGGKAMLDVRIDHARDAAEQALISSVWSSGMPVLGICRGAQMLAVVRGGNLHADIHAAYQGAARMWTPLPLKRVTIEPDTELARITRMSRLTVNSLHHQSVDRLGEGQRISARDGAGIVQAIEAPGPSLRIGVQWHPEFLFYKRPHRRLFLALVDAARAWSKARAGWVVDQAQRSKA